jgi:hypothetical protein
MGRGEASNFDVHAVTAVNTRLEELIVPGVTTLRALKVAENDALAKVSFPDLVDSDNTGIAGLALSEVDLPKLATAKDYLSFSDFEALSTLDLPELTSVGSISFGKAPSLKTVNMPKLRPRRVGDAGGEFRAQRGLTECGFRRRCCRGWPSSRGRSDVRPRRARERVRAVRQAG